MSYSVHLNHTLTISMLCELAAFLLNEIASATVAHSNSWHFAETHNSLPPPTTPNAAAPPTPTSRSPTQNRHYGGYHQGSDLQVGPDRCPRTYDDLVRENSASRPAMLHFDFATKPCGHLADSGS